MGEPARPKSDGEIQQDVLRELAWDARVEQARIGVEVRHGVVTLTGPSPAGASVWPRKRRPTAWPACSMSPMTSR